MARSIITLTTDFGTDSPYVAQMKGAILSINPEAVLVDITHGLPPQDIRQGALVLEEVTPRFPPASIHVAVVDPGVGTPRRILCAEIQDRYYIAPDNGLLSRLVRRDPHSRIFALSNPEAWCARLSATFHGRDIMAPVAAHLSLGERVETLGETVGDMQELAWPEVTSQGDRLEGTILAVDSFGNLITNITQDDLPAASRLECAEVRCAGRIVSGIIRTYGERPPGSLVALFGSGGRLEIAVVNGSAANKLQAGVGDAVAVAAGGGKGEGRRAKG
jgi:S-adenosylmethionine hydrolase